MKFSDLLKVLGREWGGQVLQPTLASDPLLTGISEDSRKTLPGHVFIARTGTKTSGTQFIPDALAKGALAIVTDQPLETPLPAHIAFAQVDNANRATALFAHALADWPARNIKMLAVTGTKGKTTVAYLLRSVLNAASQKCGYKCGMVGTVEIDDGSTPVPADMTTPSSIDLVALFTRMKTHRVTHCVMEVSSHALHQSRIAGLDFSVAIFTNLTGDHLDYHKTMDEYAAAKAILFQNLSPQAVAVINVDDPYAAVMKKECRAGIVTYGLADSSSAPPPTWSAAIENMTSDSMRLRITAPGELLGPNHTYTLNTPLVGRHNAYNLLSVLASTRACTILAPQAIKSLSTAIGAPGRLQRVDLHRPLPFQVFVDYAHTHDSLQNVLTALRATMNPIGKLLCLFGCGGDRDRTKRPKMARVAQSLADLIIVTSDNPRTENPTDIINEILLGFEGNVAAQVTVEPDRHLAILHAIQQAQPHDVVLIAGKGHENYQILGTTKHHFDDVEEAAAALIARAL